MGLNKAQKIVGIGILLLIAMCIYMDVTGTNAKFFGLYISAYVAFGVIGTIVAFIWKKKSEQLKKDATL